MEDIRLKNILKVEYCQIRELLILNNVEFEFQRCRVGYTVAFSDLTCV